MGRKIEQKEPLLVYVMSRIRGVTLLDFKISHESLITSQERQECRRNLMGDVARYECSVTVLRVRTVTHHG